MLEMMLTGRFFLVGDNSAYLAPLLWLASDRSEHMLWSWNWVFLLFLIVIHHFFVTQEFPRHTANPVVTHRLRNSALGTLAFAVPNRAVNEYPNIWLFVHTKIFG